MKTSPSFGLLGEDVNDNEKGKRYKVTHMIEVYWSDPGGEVVENPDVEKMEAID